MYPAKKVAKSLEKRYTRFQNRWSKCTRCRISKLTTKHVLWRGTLPCDILFIGEAPGATEDVTGLPFTGRAGKLLDKAIGESILGKASFAVANTIVCTPWDADRTRIGKPTDEWKINCIQRMDEFISLAKPRLIVTLGNVAHQYLERHCMDICAGNIPRAKLKHPAWILRQGGIDSGFYKSFVDTLTNLAARIDENEPRQEAIPEKGNGQEA